MAGAGKFSYFSKSHKKEGKNRELNLTNPKLRGMFKKTKTAQNMKTASQNRLN